MRRVFLADGDALALSSRKLDAILALLHRELPGLERVSSYANARNLLARESKSCGAPRPGLELLYLGLESGDDQTLADIHKGVTVAQQVEGCRRPRRPASNCRSPRSWDWPGGALAGARQATGEALSAIDPEYIGVLS